MVNTTKSIYRITVGGHLQVGFDKNCFLPVTSTSVVAKLRDPSGTAETVQKSAGTFTGVKWAWTRYSRIEIIMMMKGKKLPPGSTAMERKHRGFERCLFCHKVRPQKDAERPLKLPQTPRAEKMTEPASTEDVEASRNMGAMNDLEHTDNDE
jgi:hypothetical protein